jgi:hypothetical protein
LTKDSDTVVRVEGLYLDDGREITLLVDLLAFTFALQYKKYNKYSILYFVILKSTVDKLFFYLHNTDYYCAHCYLTKSSKNDVYKNFIFHGKYNFSAFKDSNSVNI